MKVLIALLVVAVFLGLGVFWQRRMITQWLFQPRESNVAEGGQSDLTESTDDVLLSNGGIAKSEPVQILGENLEIPWEVVELADGSYLVTERPGSLVRIRPKTQERITVDGVVHVGEGGLQGMVLHPQFESNQWLYLYLTSRSGTGLINRVERYKYDPKTTTLLSREVIIDQIPGASYHDGGRIAFGPDGKLYVTTGDAGIPQAAQDTQSLAGKILRLNDDGTVPSDNPFGNAVYSYGHRNPQGLAWDRQGRLWSTEHGPSGTGTGFDEVNLIVAGGNYGWPEVQGDETRIGMIPPVIQSGADDTWAPAGAAIVNDVLYFAGLRGVALYRTQIEGDRLMDLEAHFKGEFGRLRAVSRSRDGQWLYLTTSNQDGRGEVGLADDRVIRVSIALLN